MSVQTYLFNRASEAILSDAEQSSITTSITTLTARLKTYFDSAVTERLRFGSSTRGTILPRAMDEHSDIDYMIVFADENSKPQTYIDRLKRFAEKYYSSSDIAQSSPTIVLSLNHIKFDLVPAIKSYIQEYRIPAPNSSYSDWTATSPRAFNDELTAANIRNDSKLKPTIRLLKYWNAQAGYVFDSYSFEQWVAGRFFYNCSSVRDYFFDCVEALPLAWDAAQWRKDRVDRARKLVASTKALEAGGYPASAELEIKKLIPAA